MSEEQYKNLEQILIIKSNLLRFSKKLLFAIYLIIIFFGTHQQSFSEDVIINEYDELYHGFEYEHSSDPNLQPDSINKYSNLVIETKDDDIIEDPKSLEEQPLENVKNTHLKDLLNKTNYKKLLTNAIDDIADNISLGAKSLVQSSNGGASTSSNQNNFQNSSQNGQQPLIIGGGFGGTTTGTTNGGGSGGGTTNGGTSSGSGGGTTNSGGNTGGGGGSGEESNEPTPDPIKCRNLTDEQINARLNQIKTTSGVEQNLSLLYERSMLLFCIGDYKNAGLEIAKINQVNPGTAQTMLNDTDNDLILQRFSKVLENYKSSPINPQILEMANKVKQSIEEKNAITDQYVNELNHGFSYSTTKQLNYEEEVDKIYKMYRSEDMLKKDLESIYGTEAATEIMNSKNKTSNAGKIPEYK